jgi:hypothetical protein
MSAQETTPGHAASICDFASSTTSKPLRFAFAKAVFSVEIPDIKTDASHPYIHFHS